MKTTLLFLVFGLVAHLAAPATGGESGLKPTVVFVLARSHAEADRAMLRHSLAEFIASAPPEFHISFVDADSRQRIADVVIPKMARDTREVRRRLLAQPLHELSTWFEAVRTNVVYSQFQAMLQVPEATEFVVGLPTSGPRAVVLCGSPMPIYPNEPSFSMDQLRYPSPGQLLLTRAQSPYGVLDRSSALRDVTLHMVFPSESIWTNGFHRLCVARWWSQWTRAQDGVLASFTSDLSVVLSLVPKLGLPSVMDAPSDPTDTKPEMRFARARQIASATPAQPSTSIGPQSGVSGVTTPPVVIDRALPQQLPVETKPGATGIGIMWSKKVDLDLHVQPHPNARILAFNNTSTPEGVYLHDYRTNNDQLDFEWVELRSPVDLHALKGWVNYYEGQETSVQGRLCVVHEGRQYFREFTLNCPGGNKGRDWLRRHQSPYWLALDISGLVASGR